MSAHLQEVQEKFQLRFEKLEDELRNRDQIINQLQAHILELERAAATEESFGVGVNFANLKVFLNFTKILSNLQNMHFSKNCTFKSDQHKKIVVKLIRKLGKFANVKILKLSGNFQKF